MRGIASPLLWTGVMLASVLAAAPAGRACDIPVFRYALERWVADEYEVTVYHRGSLSPAVQQAVETLHNASVQALDYSNFRLRIVDLDADDDSGRVTATALPPEAEPPCAVLRDPKRADDRPIWVEPLTPEAAEVLVDSPARREISRRIGEGESGVWVLLESGDPARDESAARLIEEQLSAAARALHLPEPDTAPTPDDDDAPKGLRIAFSLLRVSRENRFERALVAMLLASEPDLWDVRRTMAFPVFGRGRVLYALIGDGINEANVREACEFLVEGCSCLIKVENPGTDLLMLTDWGAMLQWPGDLDVGAATVVLRPSAGAPPEEAALPSASPRSPDRSRRSDLLRKSVMGLMSGLVVVAVVAVSMRSRNRSAGAG